MKFRRAKVFSGVSVDQLAHLAVNAGTAKKMVIDAARETVQRFLEHREWEAANLASEG